MGDYLTRPRLAILECVGLLVAFIAGVAVNPPFEMGAWVYGFSIWQRLTFGLLTVLAVGTAIAATAVGLEWRRVSVARDLEAGTTNRYGLVYLTVLVAALAILLWQAWYWNLFVPF